MDYGSTGYLHCYLVHLKNLPWNLLQPHYSHTLAALYNLRNCSTQHVAELGQFFLHNLPLRVKPWALPHHAIRREVCTSLAEPPFFVYACRRHYNYGLDIRNPASVYPLELKNGYPFEAIRWLHSCIRRAVSPGGAHRVRGN